VSAATLVRAPLVEPLLAITVNVVVSLDGDLDHSVETEVSGRITQAAQLADCIQVDARHVAFIDAAGIRTLLMCKQNALGHGVTLTVLYSRPGPVERLVQLLGLASWVD